MLWVQESLVSTKDQKEKVRREQGRMKQKEREATYKQRRGVIAVMYVNSLFQVNVSFQARTKDMPQSMEAKDTESLVYLQFGFSIGCIQSYWCCILVFLEDLGKRKVTGLRWSNTWK